jgi:hypothetical protein
MLAPQGRAGRRSLYEQGEMFGKRYTASSFGSETHFIAHRLPMLLAHRMISTPTAECRSAFREPL